MPDDAASRLQCDLVMRGGITSGIVYPRAIAKLAETYDFRSIGGTSAGAIAAAATAAAAYGAKNGTNHFKAGIGGLPNELSKDRNGKTVLERLFQPGPDTGRLFRVLMSGLGRESKVVKILKIGAALCTNYWPFALLGATFALVPLLVFDHGASLARAAFVLFFLWGLVPVLLFTLAAAVGGAVRDVILHLPKNGYGLCPGSSKEVADGVGVLPLTDWLHHYFQTLANRPLDKPVTFGELWGNGGDSSAPRDIELVLMTTNITRGISQRLPFIEGSWGQLFFKKAEFDGLFPEAVVTAMYENRAAVRYPDRIEVPDGYYPLPEAPNLPILLGARMSMSFPFLLGAVPLYAADVSVKNENGKFDLVRCWFSDGGLTSNFPIHFFDAPLPTRPTFGINLVPASVKPMAEMDDGQPVRSEVASGMTPDDEESWRHIYMPAKNSGGISSAARFNQFDGIVGFFSALFDTARNWADTELTAMPGYRDRIVHVALSEDEGGLNLSMPKEVIDKVGKRGALAGLLLADRFKSTANGTEVLNDPQTHDVVQLTWDNHRWIRFRAFMAALELALRRLTATWADSAKETRWRSYEALLARGDNDFPKSYRFTNQSQVAFVKQAMAQLVDALSGLQDNMTFDRPASVERGGSPRPKPVLRMMPPGSNDPRNERAAGDVAIPPAAE